MNESALRNLTYGELLNEIYAETPCDSLSRANALLEALVEKVPAPDPLTGRCVGEGA